MSDTDTGIARTPASDTKTARAAISAARIALEDAENNLAALDRNDPNQIAKKALIAISLKSAKEALKQAQIHAASAENRLEQL